MPESKAIHIIRWLQKKWMVTTILSYYLLSLAVTLLLITVLHHFLLLPWWWVFPLFSCCLALIFFINPSPKVSEANVALFLDQQFPQLEESAGLLLKPYESLNLLEKIQVQKVAQIVNDLTQPVSFNKKLRQSGMVLLAVLAVSVTLFFIPFQNRLLQNTGNRNINRSSVLREKVLPNISSVHVVIKPPVYTGNALRAQPFFNIKAEERATVAWQIQTSAPATSIKLLFNGSINIPLRSVNKEHTLWTVQKDIRSSCFYRVEIENKLSEFYTIEIIKDIPPVITIQKPKSYTVIDYGRHQQVTMDVSIEDDYGIKEVSVSATTSSGNGEQVKFKEQKLTFSRFKRGNRRYNLQELLYLPALGMKLGDELYFYVSALDNFNQETRSNVYTVSIPDTAQLMDLEGWATLVNVKPEYFRSQRQIIIETEQLLNDQKKITVEEFKSKSHDLGIDQKLLRMRYGKFLGEETEENTGAGFLENQDVERENHRVDIGNTPKIPGEVIHKHDHAEDAGFFDAATKKQLNATLAEMWNAELRLLKDLQEKGRAYAAKSSAATPPLKTEKRLSGDLGKIIEPVHQATFKKSESGEDVVRSALRLLENLKDGTDIDETSFAILQQAGLQLNTKAAAEPASYLAAVGCMNHILDAVKNTTGCSVSDIRVAQKGLQRMLHSPAVLPYSIERGPDLNLSQHYFKNLKRLNP